MIECQEFRLNREAQEAGDMKGEIQERRCQALVEKLKKKGYKVFTSCAGQMRSEEDNLPNSIMVIMLNPKMEVIDDFEEIAMELGLFYDSGNLYFQK